MAFVHLFKERALKVNLMINIAHLFNFLGSNMILLFMSDLTSTIYKLKFISKLRECLQFTEKKNTVQTGQETISYRRPQLQKVKSKWNKELSHFFKMLKEDKKLELRSVTNVVSGVYILPMFDMCQKQKYVYIFLHMHGSEFALMHTCICI